VGPTCPAGQLASAWLPVAQYVHALLLSRLDYGNATLAGIPLRSNGSSRLHVTAGPPYMAVDCRRPSFSCCRCTHLERPATPRHVRITSCFPKPSEDTPLPAFFPQLCWVPEKWLLSLLTRDVVLGTCTCNRVVLQYKSRVLVLVLVLEEWVFVLVLVLATLSSKY